jgi:hypothetical protein
MSSKNGSNMGYAKPKIAGKMPARICSRFSMIGIIAPLTFTVMVSVTNVEKGRMKKG